MPEDLKLYEKRGWICPPEKEKIEVYDSETKRLYAVLRRTQPGRARYGMNYKPKGTTSKAKHLPLGDSETYNVDAIRRIAGEWNVKIDAGIYPDTSQRDAARVNITLQKFFDEYYLPQAKIRKRSWQDDLMLYKREIKPALGNRRLIDIRRHEVQQLHQTIIDRGKAASTANHVLRLIKRLYNVAIELEILVKNPAASIKLFPEENQRDISLTNAEAQKLLQELRTNRNRLICNLALLLWVTGARKSEALMARWVDIDRDARIWRIPASNSKSKKIRAIPLNAAALQVLDALGTEGEHEYLFVSPQTGERLKYVGKSWGRIREAAGLPWLRLHDLRHLFAGNAVKAGTSLYVVQHLLGHADPRVTQRYAHLSVQDTLGASELASRQLADALAEPVDS